MFSIKWAVAPACPSDEFDDRVKHIELGQLLVDGWEPFAVTCQPFLGTEYVWLRKEVKTEE